MKVCFIGHRTVANSEVVKVQLEETVAKLIADGADTFLFGSRSDFDSLSWEVVTQLQQQHPNIKRISYNAPHERSFTSPKEREYFERLYLHFIGKEIQFKEYEGSVDASKCVGATYDIYVMRNYEMIDDSDVCVFYYNKEYLPPRRKQSKRNVVDYQPRSGTAVSFIYAQRKNKKIINLFC